MAADVKLNTWPCWGRIRGEGLAGSSPRLFPPCSGPPTPGPHLPALNSAGPCSQVHPLLGQPPSQPRLLLPGVETAPGLKLPSRFSLGMGFGWGGGESAFEGGQQERRAPGGSQTEGLAPSPRPALPTVLYHLQASGRPGWDGRTSHPGGSVGMVAGTSVAPLRAREDTKAPPSGIGWPRWNPSSSTFWLCSLGQVA